MIEFVAEFFPLVLLDLGCTTGPHKRMPEDFVRMFSGFRAANRKAMREGSRYVLIAVTQDVPTALERKLLVEESNKISASEQAYCAVSILVIPNGIIRGVVTVLSWMIPHMSPIAAAPTTDAAVELAAQQVRKLGIDCPIELETKASQWFRRHEPRSIALGAGKGSP